MATAKKTFVTKVKCQLGWEYPDAFVAIRYASESSQTTYTSEADDCISDYQAALDAGVIVYQGNFWGNQAGQIAGLPSRPLISDSYTPAQVEYEKDEEGEIVLDSRGKKVTTGEIVNGFWALGDLLAVDLEHPQSRQVIESSMTPVDKIFRLIELDVIRRFL